METHLSAVDWLFVQLKKSERGSTQWNEIRGEIWKHHRPFGVWFVNRFFKERVSRDLRWELYGIADERVLWCIDRFEARKGRFTTYCGQAIWRRCQQHLYRHGKKFGRELTVTDLFQHCEEGIGTIETVRGHYLQDLCPGYTFEELLRFCHDDRNRAVLSMRFGEVPQTYEQIGEQVGVSKQRVQQIIKSELHNMRKRILDREARQRKAAQEAARPTGRGLAATG